MKKTVLSSSLATALLTASSLAIAQPPPTGPSPELWLHEKGAITCIEQSLSMLATLVDSQGCGESAGSYTLDGEAYWNGNAECTIHDADVFVTTVRDTLRGTEQRTSSTGRGEIGDVSFFNLDGHFFYSGEGEIMYAYAYVDLCVPTRLNPDRCNACPDCLPTSEGGPAENHDEHVIKDFWATANPNRVVRDAGLEVVTKGDDPRRKFRETSRYVPPNGGIGSIRVNKTSVAPDNAPQCHMTYTAEVDDFSEGLQFVGDVIVRQLAGGG